MRLPRLSRVPLVGTDRSATQIFRQWWQSLVTAIENLMPKSSGLGEWTVPDIDAPGGTITLPAGGRWAYFVSNNGAGFAGVADGGDVVFTTGGPALVNAFGFCWRVE